jgi:O-methyltransferase involved in polyketide biosynthesis
VKADGEPSLTAFTSAAARAQVTCRSRYTEDSLAAAVRREVGQYVVLGVGLDRAGFDFAEPAFVGWLGGTMYLDSGAIERTVSVVGGFAPGTEVVVDYMLPGGWRDAAGDTYAELIGQASAEQGEPWLSLFTPDTMAALLARNGFGSVRDVRQRDMIPAAAWERSDPLCPAELSHIAHARLCCP